MEEKTLLMLSVVFAMVGLSVLYGVFVNSEPLQATFISKHVDETVSVSGRVVSVQAFDGRTEFTLLREDYVSITFFDTVNVYEGAEVTVVGEVGEYEGRVSIVGQIFAKD